jgi:4-aminobutyrate aminotransferase-like enzyme
VTWLGERFPVFWEEARGANVRDADGNVYLDLTGAFGVALVGHAHPRVERAVREQAARLLHGMGDLHPPAVKVLLMERLAALSPWPDARVVLANTGSEAVEIALKTALLATGRPGILAFEGAYHGLTLGSLAATSRGYFRAPFAARLFGGVEFAPFPDPREGDRGVEEALARVEEALERGAPGGHPIGAVVVEPVQGRAGVRIPPAGFLAKLGERARARGALVVADEVLTGMGRTGRWFAAEHFDLAPDIVVLGKGLNAGVAPLSAVVTRRQLLDELASRGVSFNHAQTYSHHPVTCAAGLATLRLLRGRQLVERVAALEAVFLGGLATLRRSPLVGDVRGKGLLAAVELVADRDRKEPFPRSSRVAERLTRAAFERGLVVWPNVGNADGERGDLVVVAPPFVISEAEIDLLVDRLRLSLEDLS